MLRFSGFFVFFPPSTLLCFIPPSCSCFYLSLSALCPYSFDLCYHFPLSIHVQILISSCFPSIFSPFFLFCVFTLFLLYLHIFWFIIRLDFFLKLHSCVYQRTFLFLYLQFLPSSISRISINSPLSQLTLIIHTLCYHPRINIHMYSCIFLPIIAASPLLNLSPSLAFLPHSPTELGSISLLAEGGEGER